MVLKALPKYASDYETKDWDIRMAKVRTVLDFPNFGLQSRDLVLGIDRSESAEVCGEYL